MRKNKADLLDEKIEAQNKLLKSQLVIMKNVDARIEGIRNLLIVKNVFTDDEYQRSVDACLGLKRKDAETDVIEKGDIVWVNYVASDVNDLANQMIEKGLPLRIGSGAVPFEAELLGKPFNLKGHCFELDFDGRKFKFLVDIVLVKTKVGENPYLDALEE